MNDTNPQPNEDYNNPEDSPYTAGGASGTPANPVDTSSSSAPQNFVIPDIPPLPGSASQHQAPQATPQYEAPEQTSQSTAAQATPQYEVPQQTPQYEAQQPAPQYDAPQAAPQYSASQQAPQYDSAQQDSNNVPPQYAANQSMDFQGGTPAFPNGAPSQPYGNLNPNNSAPAAAVPLNRPYYGCPPIEAVKRFFLNYVRFSGRASRSEFWWVQLFLLIFYFVLLFLDVLLFRKAAGFIDIIVGLALFIPNLSITIRRLHDSNKSGWWWLLPYGLDIAGGMIMVLSMVVGIGGMAISGPSKSSFETAGAGMVIAMLIAFLCMLAGFVLEIVLMVLGPNPEGARFDESLPPESLVNGQYMPPMNQGNPPANQYGQYAQPMQQQQQNPLGEQYPQTTSQQASANYPYAQPANPQNIADNQYGQPASQEGFGTDQYGQGESSQTFSSIETQYQSQHEAHAEETGQSQNPFGQQDQQTQQGQQPNNGLGAEDGLGNNVDDPAK
ncbi:DUF805 domain-containing protein [Bifidobacterium sp. ESL0798]|uniref:DUF805 domain-containing protein n=1 Tax=Bifidobacterium sp. ESL0798 TaxID=2983235 RepID=UPI0023F79234|nr:DUF805 domain-containing protein [Bifidobacterium sp. ESL0798]WEV73858.1 DUF805 domain-containing protein [Bifidobacterium sp. ESL0798]